MSSHILIFTLLYHCAFFKNFFIESDFLSKCKFLGITIRVSNCTVHGGWTAWSGWSACSATCGVAVKWRRRACGAPAPINGGRLCVGPDRSEIYCTQNPPCPGK